MNLKYVRIILITICVIIYIVLTLTVEDNGWFIIPLLIMISLRDFNYVRIILAIIFSIICIGLILILENDIWILIPFLIMTYILTSYDKEYHKKHDHE